MNDEVRPSGHLVQRRALLHPSSLRLHRSGYTLVELFLTLIVVMIILGVMLNLAKRVRGELADKATRQILARLTVLLDQYQQRNDGQLPPIAPVLLSRQRPTEETLAALALANNADLVRYLNLRSAASRAADDSLAPSLRTTATGQTLLEDPWGSPIVFMPHQDPAIGMAPSDTFFLFSAGPDRQYLTREDNLYSYEESVGINAE